MTGTPGSDNGAHASPVAFPRMFVLGIGGPYNSGKSTLADALVKAGAFQIDVDKLGHLALEDCREAVISRFGHGILAAPGTSTTTAPVPIDRKALGRVVFSDPQALRDLEAITHPAMVRRVAEIITTKATESGAALNTAPRDAIASVFGIKDFRDSRLDSSGVSGPAHTGDGHSIKAVAATQGSTARRSDYAAVPAETRAAAEQKPFSIKNVIVVNAALLFKMKLHVLCDLPIWVEAPVLLRLARALKRDKLGLKATWKRMRSQTSIWPQLNGANADIQRVKNLRRDRSIRELAAILQSRGLRTEDAALLE